MKVDQSIWLVDDDADDQYLFKKAFREANPNLQVCTLDDGNELLARLHATNEPPRVIVMDLNMSPMTGLETLEQVRLMPKFRQLPVIILSSSSSPNDINSSMGLGANEYFTKPGNFTSLVKLAGHIKEKWLTA